jgi:hypothetical protein
VEGALQVSESGASLCLQVQWHSQEAVLISPVVAKFLILFNQLRLHYFQMFPANLLLGIFLFITSMFFWFLCFDFHTTQWKSCFCFVSRFAEEFESLYFMGSVHL